MLPGIKTWFNTGTPYIWLTAGAVSVAVLMVLGLTGLIAMRGLGHFWPAPIAVFDYTEADGTTAAVIGELVERESVTRLEQGSDYDKPGAAATVEARVLIKTGNRDVSGRDFRWVTAAGMSHLVYDRELMVIERRAWGNLYGYLHGLENKDKTVLADIPLWELLQQYIEKNTGVFNEIRHIEKNMIGAINYDMEKLRLKKKGLMLKEITAPAPYAAIRQEQTSLQKEYAGLTDRLGKLYQELNQISALVGVSDGAIVTVPLASIVHAARPNAMSLADKMAFYFRQLWEFMSGEPREANTEGGIFPAIFGTVMMVMIMAVLVTPFGVVAAVYLHEYARQGPVTRLIRIAVNNLAGVPSVVYGVFGLGFFIYFLGGSIDELFFNEALPTPTFGTPGLLWASLTLALLTVPVVIVATEEGLSRVPRAIREGSLALGATQAETLWRTVMPMTAPAIMTGLILAVARAAGEVAPLMLVGVVKLAPSLPLDGNAPYLHLERKFMHLGFHIYDVGFQSPNVEAARPLVFATAFLLIAIIIILNLAAIKIRNTLREQHRAAEQ